MSEKPVILLVDDDPEVLAAIRRDVRRQYRADYRILATESAAEALETLETLARERRGPVAMILSDQRMPGMNGVDLLEKAREIAPQAKRLLLTAYSDTEAAIKAINDVRLDYYLTKPWDPPEERIYPVLDELLFDWRLSYRPTFQGHRLVGFQWSPESHRLKDFLAGNFVPYRWFDVESGAADGLIEQHGLDRLRLPAVLLEDGEVLVEPSNGELAQAIGLTSQAKADLYDVAIVGAGPAGLAAAVYGASEGLRTLLVERHAPGGQAGTSSRIENYLGFPNGLSGPELTRRAITQARRLGAELMTPGEVARLEPKDPLNALHLTDGTTILSRAVVIASGVQYRHLPAEGTDRLTGAGVYYGAATTEAAACAGQDVYIVGGGNSAGQAAVLLSQHAARVFLVIRRPDLSATMSAYLIHQLEAIENVEVLGRTVVAEGHGESRLEAVTLESLEDGSRRREPAVALYVFIGQRPSTGWLDGVVLTDGRGFVETGSGVERLGAFRASWPLERSPLPLETSIPGVFAAGDVRSGGMNRVASAVGEGAMAIKLVHDYLAGS